MAPNINAIGGGRGGSFSRSKCVCLFFVAAVLALAFFEESSFKIAQEVKLLFNPDADYTGREEVSLDHHNQAVDDVDKIDGGDGNANSAPITTDRPSTATIITNQPTTTTTTTTTIAATNQPTVANTIGKSSTTKETKQNLREDKNNALKQAEQEQLRITKALKALQDKKGFKFDLKHAKEHLERQHFILPSDDGKDIPTFLERSILSIQNKTKDRLNLVQKCQAIKVPKPKTPLDCETMPTIPGESIYPTFLDSPLRNPNHSKYKWRNVTVMEDTDWGFTCNKIEIMSGAIISMLRNRNFPEADTNMLALGPFFSSFVYDLDLRFLTRDFPVLIDCAECEGAELGVKIIRCGSVVVDGKIIDLANDGLLPYTNKYYASDMYWLQGPSNLGLHPSLALYILPSEAVRKSVETVMYQQLDIKKNPILGIHRRDMENWCYIHLGNGRGEFECHLDGQANPIIDKLVEVEAPKKFKEGFNFKPLEENYPWLMVCNLTLDQPQLELFEKEWPEVFSPLGKKFQVFFTTDSNDPSGDEIMKRSPSIGKLYRMQEINSNDTLCSTSKHRRLFYDMYGLALSDFHMANPVSSCDITVVHWRRLLQKAVGTSYPKPCYEGYYTQPIRMN